MKDLFGKFKDFEHILRMLAVFFLAIAGFLLVRKILIPESFGRIGHYRADAIDEIKAFRVGYGGSASCVKCHDARVKEKKGGKHRNVGCENCHGALASHVESPSRNRPVSMKNKADRKFCLRCHEKSFSRPANFPQVNPEMHNPDAVCVGCHNPHNPQP